MPYKPINYGNILAGIESIKGQRYANALARDPNSLDKQLKRAQLADYQRKLKSPQTHAFQDPSLKDFTAESVAKYKVSGDPGVLVRYNKPRQPVKIDTGDAFEFYDTNAAGEPILLKSIPKQLGPSQTVEHAEDVEAAKQEVKQTYEPETAAKTATSKGQASRSQLWIDEGLAAADALPTMKRTITLLESGVKTGGWDNLKLWATDAFGVTGADEGELSANLGKAVLSQLRSTFGAQFTEREGARLERIEAGFGKSPAVNLRLMKNMLQITEKAAKRGLTAAKATKDLAAATEITRMMEMTLGEEGANIDAQLKALEEEIKALEAQ